MKFVVLCCAVLGLGNAVWMFDGPASGTGPPTQTENAWRTPDEDDSCSRDGRRGDWRAATSPIDW